MVSSQDVTHTLRLQSKADRVLRLKVIMRSGVDTRYTYLYVRKKKKKTKQ